MYAEYGASLYFGFNRKISKDEYRERIENNTLTEVLNKVEAKQGDIFFIEPGTVHAIGAGLIICEVQQNSNTTYRVCDYGRRGADGKLRELHIDKALDVSVTAPPEIPEYIGKTQEKNGYTSQLIAKCKYFTSEKITIDDMTRIPLDKTSFRSVIVTDGAVIMKVGDTVFSLKSGDSVFIPAQDGILELMGDCDIILSYV